MAEIPSGQEAARVRYVVDPNYRPRGGQRSSLRIDGNLDVRSTAPIFGMADRMGLLAAAPQLASPVALAAGGSVVVDPGLSVEDATSALSGLSAAVQAVVADSTVAERAAASALVEHEAADRLASYSAAHDLQEASRALQAAAVALSTSNAPSASQEPAPEA